MGRRLSDIRFVDLKKSEVNWAKSDPEHGKYVFKGEPVYIDYTSDSAPLPEHKVQFVESDPGNVDRWKFKYDYELVKWTDKLYWPEGFVPNAEGLYTYRDVILMMCKADLYVARKKRELEKSVNAAANVQKDFHELGRQHNVETYDMEDVQDMRKHLRR